MPHPLNDLHAMSENGGTEFKEIYSIRLRLQRQRGLET